MIITSITSQNWGKKTLEATGVHIHQGLRFLVRGFKGENNRSTKEEDGIVCISKHVATRLWTLREQKHIWSMALLMCSS
jgi:hypothetical protein